VRVQIAQPAIDRVAGSKPVKKVHASLAADVERIKQEYLARRNREKQQDALKKERAKAKMQEIKEREKQEDEGTLHLHHVISSSVPDSTRARVTPCCDVCRAEGERGVGPEGGAAAEGGDGRGGADGNKDQAIRRREQRRR
jgi:hypothetical protein